MSQPEIIIRFDKIDSNYSPGDALSGDYRLEGIEADQIGAVEVSVVWFTEGKGDQDMAVHEFWRTGYDRGEIVGPDRPQRFSTTLPLSPLTYDGQIVKIRWCVRVRLLFQRGKDLVAQRLFRLGDVPPAPPVGRDTAESIGHATAADKAAPAKGPET